MFLHMQCVFKVLHSTQVYLTIIPQARVGYEMVDSHSNKGEWNNCFIKNAPKIEQTKLKKIKTPEKNHAYACHIRRAWYNGSYTMMAKPMKTLELHYPMIQFLIKMYTGDFNRLAYNPAID